MLSIRHSIGKTPLLEHMANDSKSVAHFRCYAIAPPPGVYALFDAGSPEEWYDTYDGTTVKDRRGLLVNVGGAAVANLQQNLLFFGVGQSGPDRGKAVYHRFAALAAQYDSE